MRETNDNVALDTKKCINEYKEKNLSMEWDVQMTVLFYSFST